MEQGVGLAEVRLVRNQMSLFGSITRLSDRHIAVRLHTVPVTPSALAPGVAAQVFCTRHGAIFSSRASIVGQQGQDLVLAFERRMNGPGAATDRREADAARVPCGVPVRYRAVRHAGPAGAWRAGTIVDISPNSAGVLLEPCPEVPQRLELRFNLASADPWDGKASRDDDGSRAPLGALNDNHTSRVVGRTARCAIEPDGRIRVGLSFLAVAPMDRERIERFVEGAGLVAA